MAAGRLVWKVDSGSGAGSGAAAPRAAPWARRGIAHRPVLGGLELGHAHSFDMRHVMPFDKLNVAVQTCQGTGGTEISSRELGLAHAAIAQESEDRSTADALS